jgi:protein-S-isoprenylcysteine O-methyltransferase Ste14
MNVFVFLLAVLFGFVFRQRIGVEEKMLIEHYGDAYLRYQKDVPMLIPALLAIKKDRVGSG